MFSDGVRACMTDQQRGIGMNPPRGMIDVFNNPNGHDERQEEDMTQRGELS